MRLRDGSQPVSIRLARTPFVIFSRFVRHSDGTDVRCQLRPDGRYYLVVSTGSRQTERVISKDAAYNYFIERQETQAVVFAIEELKRDLRQSEH